MQRKEIINILIEEINDIDPNIIRTNHSFENFTENDQTILEREPLEKIVQKNELSAFKHNGFWQCMDTKRDKDKLEEIYNSKNIPWAKSD